MKDATELLSELNLQNVDETRLEVHVTALSVNSDVLSVEDNGGNIQTITPFSEGANDSLLDITIVDDNLIQLFSVRGEVSIPLSRRSVQDREMSLMGEGFAFSVTGETVQFNNPFQAGFTLTEFADRIEVALVEDETSDPVIGLSYDNYAAFAHLSTTVNNTGFSGGDVANTRVPITHTLVNNIPLSAHRANGGNTIYLQPGLYWTKLTICGYAADSQVCGLALNTVVYDGRTSLSSQSAVGKVNQDCCGRVVVTSANSQLYINQSRTRGTMVYGGGDEGDFNVNLLLEVWKIG